MGDKKDILNDYAAQLEWIKFREDALGAAAIPVESRTVKKMKENPLVPIGAFGTVCALGYGLWCFKKGKSRQSQTMMRARIAAQGFTVVAILGGLLMGNSKNSSSAGKPS